MFWSRPTYVLGAENQKISKKMVLLEFFGMRIKMKNKKKAVKLAPKDYVNTLIWFLGDFGQR